MKRIVFTPSRTIQVAFLALTKPVESHQLLFNFLNLSGMLKNKLYCLNSDTNFLTSNTGCTDCKNKIYAHV